MDLLNLENSFKLIGKDWMLITAKNGDKVNTMTASWGGFGHLWNKNVVYIFIRPQRYTYEFVEQTNYFTLSFFEEKYREALSFLGKVSGREMNKIKEVGFNVAVDGEYASFDESNLVIKCKKIAKLELDPNSFLDEEIEKFYKNDYHYMYIGEIVEVEDKRNK
jgi:flavin reductase (DIM6/NTAB) family NADH-FMN oxidoreductase RutF